MMMLQSTLLLPAFAFTYFSKPPELTTLEKWKAFWSYVFKRWKMLFLESGLHTNIEIDLCKHKLKRNLKDYESRLIL